ncbi:hypothetical protein [Streptomyces fractus]|uniref:hypothetical protein n=1 Tax=Streptomyces fractus TaxID=641806 RepID=UPI003CF15919
MDRMYEGYDELAELLDDLLRAHARELAEKIRNHDPSPAPVWRWSDEYTDGVHTSADLIDPKERQ